MLSILLLSLLSGIIFEVEVHRVAHNMTDTHNASDHGLATSVAISRSGVAFGLSDIESTAARISVEGKTTHQTAAAWPELNQICVDLFGKNICLSDLGEYFRDFLDAAWAVLELVEDEVQTRANQFAISSAEWINGKVAKLGKDIRALIYTKAQEQVKSINQTGELTDKPFDSYHIWSKPDSSMEISEEVGGTFNSHMQLMRVRGVEIILKVQAKLDANQQLIDWLLFCKNTTHPWLKDLFCAEPSGHMEILSTGVIKLRWDELVVGVARREGKSVAHTTCDKFKAEVLEMDLDTPQPGGVKGFLTFLSGIKGFALVPIDMFFKSHLGHFVCDMMSGIIHNQVNNRVMLHTIIPLIAKFADLADHYGRKAARLALETWRQPGKAIVSAFVTVGQWAGGLIKRGWKSVFDDEEEKALEREDIDRLTRLFVTTARVAMYTPPRRCCDDFTKQMYAEYFGVSSSEQHPHQPNEVSTFPGKASTLIHGDYSMANVPTFPSGQRWQPPDVIQEGNDVSIDYMTATFPPFASAFLMNIDLALGAAAVQDKFITSWDVLKWCSNYLSQTSLLWNQQCPVAWNKVGVCLMGPRQAWEGNTTIPPDCDKRVPVRAFVMVDVKVRGLKYDNNYPKGPDCTDLTLDFNQMDQSLLQGVYPVEEGLKWMSTKPGMNFGLPRGAVNNIWAEFGIDLIVPWIKWSIRKHLCAPRSWDQLFIIAAAEQNERRGKYFNKINSDFNTAGVA